VPGVKRSTFRASDLNASSSTSPMPGWRTSVSVREIFSTFSNVKTASFRRLDRYERAAGVIRLDGAYDDLQKIRDTPIAAGGRTLRLETSQRSNVVMRPADLPDPS